MDNAIEQIKLLAEICELHLVIELSPDSLKSTIIDFSPLKLLPGVHPLLSIIDSEISKRLNIYLRNTKSVSYAFYPSKRITGISNINTIRMMLLFIKKNKINILHFDTTSGRFLPALPFLINHKIIATIHDPVPHIGEHTFKKKIIAYVYQAVISKYLFYSKFAADQFLQVKPNLSTRVYVAKLLPYSYIASFGANTCSNHNYLLYFGRVSYYKGVDMFLNALDELWDKIPDLKVVIAGKMYGNMELDMQSKKRKSNISFLATYIPIEKLHELIKNSKFIVCPYREATQSGVVMTSLAMKKPILATNVGAFSEYIISHKNGFLTEPNEASIAEGIKIMLDNHLYQKLEHNMKSQDSAQDIMFNVEAYQKLYEIE